MNYPVILEKPASRIVSLVPSQTELLYDLNLDDQIVGVTSFCVHPKHWLEEKRIVGGTKDAQVGLIKQLQPDLIIANKEENPKQLVNQLKTICPVYISDVLTVQDALQMMKDVSLLTDRQQIAVELIDEITERFEELPRINKTAAYFIWKDPYMLVGQNNFINSILETIGLKNVVTEDRYLEKTIDEVKQLQPEVVLLSTEPYAFNERDKKDLQNQLNTSVHIVDGEMFSWYGSRMVKMPDYFRKLANTLAGTNK